MAPNSVGAEIEVLEYPACPGSPPVPAWDGWLEAGEDDATEGIAGDFTHERGKGARGNISGGAPGEGRADDVRRSFESGRERGRLEERHAEREAQVTALAAEEERYKRQLAVLVERFAVERDSFLHAAEQEVVKLALAVAARILRREAQMDPLLLTGAVRVALGQLAASSEVRLIVPKAEVDLWIETIALVPNLALKPIVVAGDGMRVGDCVIESKMGTVDLGVRSQLGEIERGFFDRAGSSSKRGTGEVARESPVAQAAPDSEAQT